VEGSLFSTKEFAEWSKQVVLFLHVTSHVDDEPYPNLLYETGGIGFPTVSFLDQDGRVLQQVGNIVSLEDCDHALEKLQGWKALRAEVERGGAGADKEKQLFLLELELGNRPFAEMVQRRDALSLAAAELAATEQPLVNLQFTEILRATPRNQPASGGEQFLAMFRAGRIPDTSTETSYWQYMFAFAKDRKDAALFRELLDWLRSNRKNNDRFMRYAKLLEKQLEQLESGK
jgi:hypothetical protein